VINKEENFIFKRLFKSKRHLSFVPKISIRIHDAKKAIVEM
jgi:hypothetical protein